MVRILKICPQDECHKFFREWQRRRGRCIAVQGKFFDEDNCFQLISGIFVMDKVQILDNLNLVGLFGILHIYSINLAFFALTIN